MTKTTSPKKQKSSKFTGIRMDRSLYNQAKKRAAQKHQSYSDYVRQLIVVDLVGVKEAAQ